MDILIDTNFILTCVKQKIDFFSQLRELFGEPRFLVPKQVLDELNKLSDDGRLKSTEREAVRLTRDIIKRNFAEIIDLKISNVDAGIIKYAEKYANGVVLYIATLDRKLKVKIKNKKIKFLTIKRKKMIEVAQSFGYS